MSTKKNQPYPHIEQLEQYEKLVQTILELERKGKKTPYTSLNGHMFSFMDKEGVLSLRLSTEGRTAFIEKYKFHISIRYIRSRFKKSVE